MPIQRLATDFADAAIFIPEVFEDERGFFKETYSTAKYRALGLTDEFVQDSVSFSNKNVLRGLHFDRRMSKFVQVLRGTIFDVIADIRPGSLTFGHWQGFELSESSHRQLYIPPGFAHGFLTLTGDVIFSYKHGALYDPQFDGAVRWNDPTLAVTWPLTGEPRLSAKDRGAPLLGEINR
ncbi:MAG: dTDP-4-dehydrorhamnose 3,5-epimerase [Candidatus Eremiobacteraeota bacterium]|nr:dTDP-4-dehydrorhamnose 3,5-epimerase [Candidatus Eremiobacteraeota bacterium]